MTNLEKAQPDSSFIKAGATAYKLGIPQLNNPYARTNKASLWERGWKRAQAIDKPAPTRKFKSPRKGTR